MIESNRLALMSCHHCGKPFKNQDSICTISHRRFNNYNMTFENLVTMDIGVEIPVEINFHKFCFEEVAGQRYTP